MTLDTIHVLMPEILLVITATWIFMVGAFSNVPRNWSWFALAGLLFAAAGLAVQASGNWLSIRSPVSFDNLITGNLAGRALGPVSFDRLGYLVCWASVIVGLLLVLQAGRAEPQGPAPEWVGSLLLTIAGVMLASRANDLVLLFMALELVSIPTYVLLLLSRRDRAAREATVKYFLLSILSSALMLYGFSFLYGVAGSTHLADLHRVIAHPAHDRAPLSVLLRLGLILSFAGLGFKITLVPMHFYAPDVYQGTTHASAAMLSAVPKIAGVVVLLRLAAAARPELTAFGWQLFLALSVVTMTVGNVLALWQRNIRRMLAYSSIAQAGYLLVGVAVWCAWADRPAGRGQELATPAMAIDGLAATLFYLLVYVLATVGTFAALGYLGRRERQIDGVDELAGLARSHPVTAAAIAIFMLSLTGLPPLAGFAGKFVLILRALSVALGPSPGPSDLRRWFIALSVITMLNAAISGAYYLRVVSTMYFRPQLGVPRAEGGSGAALSMGFSALLVVAVGLYPGPWLERSHVAAQGASSPLGFGRLSEAGSPAPGESSAARAAGSHRRNVNDAPAIAFGSGGATP